jgi:surface protein
MHAIALLAMAITLFTAQVISEIDPNAVNRQIADETETLAESGFRSLAGAWEDYRIGNQVLSWDCQTYVDGNGVTREACERIITDPGYLPASGWQSALEPQYGFMPSAPPMSQWQYNNAGAQSLYFCLEGTFDVDGRRGLARAAEALAPASMAISDQCGETTDRTFADDYTGNVAMTYWLEGNEVEGTRYAACANAAIGTVCEANINGTDHSLYVVDDASVDQAVSSGINHDGVTYTATLPNGIYTGNVTDMDQLFFNRSTFNGEIGYWDTSSVTSMEQTFANAQQFDQDISAWNTGNVTSMAGMFSATTVSGSAFNQDISAWDVSNVVDMRFMFDGATQFDQDLSAWDVSDVVFFNGMFRDTNYNGDIGAWRPISGRFMSRMFQGNDDFNADISGWDTGAAEQMNRMFDGAQSFQQDLTAWPVAGVTACFDFARNAGLTSAEMPVFTNCTR